MARERSADGVGENMHTHKLCSNGQDEVSRW